MQGETVVGYALSPQQRRVWSEQTQCGRVFAAQVAVWIDGELDLKTFSAAVDDVVRRHEILRTRFVRLPGMGFPLQVVDASRPIDIRMRSTPFGRLEGEREENAELDSAWRELWNEPFDLETGSSLRVELVAFSSRRHALVLSLPALCADNVGLANLVRSIRHSYIGFETGEVIADPVFQYADFAAVLNEHPNPEPGRGAGAAEDDRGIPRPALPGEVNSATPKDFEPRTVPLPVTPRETEMVEALAHELKSSLYGVLWAVWRVLLCRLTGERALVSRVCRDGREFREVERALGLFAWSVPVGDSIDESALFTDVVNQVDPALSSSLAVPVSAPAPSSDGPSASFEFVELSRDDLPGRLTFRISRQEASIERFSIQLSLVQENGHTTAQVRYDASRFSADAAGRIADALSTLLTSILANPQSPVAALEILSEAERDRIVRGFNETDRDYGGPISVADLFERAAAARENEIAVMSGPETLTYFELNRRANQLAAHLRDLGASSDTVVGVCLNRSVHFPVAVLSVLKAGAAWLPLDPAYPAERLTAILKDAWPAVLLTEGNLAANLTDATLPVVRIDLDHEDISRRSPENVKCSGSQQDAAYVIYTSGSTGQPKGVVLTRAGLANYLQAMGEALAIDPSDLYLHTASIGFSSSVRQLLLPLTHGATSVIASPDELRDPLLLLDQVKRQGVTVIDVVPSFWRAAMDVIGQLEGADRDALMDNSLRVVLSASEPLSFDLVRRWRTEFGQETPVINMYGQTETTGIVAVYQVPQDLPDRAEVVPLGRPIGNVRIHVLGSSGAPIPAGAIGEVWVGGAGLARGYLHNEGSTRDAFLPDPFSSDTGARLYRTGDLGLFRTDGTLEYRGRRDGQIKIRGFRVEPGEVEIVLGRHPGVRESVVGLRKDPAGEARLVAWIVRHPGASTSVRELRGFLRLRLPDYMNPTACLFLEGLPKTPTGKVDRRQLPDPDWARTGRQAQRTAPRNELEKTLAALWCEALGLEEIGIHDDFFDSGGHSLSATRVMARTRSLCGIEFPVRVLFECPTIAAFAKRVYQHRDRGVVTTRAAPLIPVPRDGTIPLSFAQQRLWFLDQLEPGSSAYNVPIALRLGGPLDIAALEKSLNEILQRHDALRTRFPALKGLPVQMISPSALLPLPEVDLTKVPAPEREGEALRRVAEEAALPFDLAAGPLVRGRRLVLSDDEQILVLTMHHIVSDGWSARILLRELAVLYDAFRNGRGSPLPELPIQYADYALWQRQRLQGETLERELSYWRERLKGKATQLDLPTDRPRPAVASFRGRTETAKFPQTLLEDLKAVSREEGVTLFMTLLAAFQTLLGRCTGQDDIWVGSPIAGRTQIATESLIGFFVNTLVLRGDLSDDPTFRELLGRSREVALGAYAHQELPFEKLVEELQPARSLSVTPLFQVMFSLENTGKEIEFSGLTVKRVRVSRDAAHFDLSLSVAEKTDGLSCFLEYRSELFDASTVRRMLKHLETLLEGIAADPDRRLSQLPLLTASERHEVLVLWNQTETDYPKEKAVHRLFAEQAERTPDAVAVEFKRQRLTYGELNRRSNQLARYLRGMGVGPEVLVGLCLERSLEMLVALFGILKAGGAYLPLDATYPQERLAFMLEDSKAALLLTRRGVAAIPEDPLTRAVFLEECSEAIARESGENLESGTSPSSLAYIIYTSGSTGLPKGVEIEHASLTNYAWFAVNRFRLRSEDRVLQFASLSFDAAAEEIFSTLTAGATLVLRSEDMIESAGTFLARCRERNLTVLDLPTAYWHELVAAASAERFDLPDSLRMMIVGGERALPERFRQWQEMAAGRVQFLNGYGPTEATIAATFWEPASEVDTALETVPIGRPIANARAYVLDGMAQPVPPGFVGELYLGGAGVARGYRGRPDLTHDRFVLDRFTGEGRLYRTGDRVRYRPDGNLEYLGRVDGQVKVRGFRVELGEVEAAMRGVAGVRDAVVRAREDAPGETRLIGYIVWDPVAPITLGELRRRLYENLPSHMVPSLFVSLEKLPRTSSGKLDPTGLPSPDADRPEVDSTYEAPRTPSEETLVEIWKKVLRLDRVGVHDNFFELGGHSLLATQVVSRARDAFRLDLPLRDLFLHPTVAQLALAIAQRQAEGIAPAEMDRILADLEASAGEGSSR